MLAATSYYVRATTQTQRLPIDHYKWVTMLTLTLGYCWGASVGRTDEQFRRKILGQNERYLSQQSAPNINNETIGQKISPNLQSYALALLVDSNLAIPGNIFVDFGELEEKMKSLMEASSNLDPSGKQKANICKVCGKEGQGKVIKDHIEANHLEGVIIPCNICKKTFRCRNSFRKHAKEHQN